MPRPVRLGHQLFDLAANELARLIAENARRGRVQHLNNTALVDGDDAVDRRIEDRMQQLRPGQG